MAGATGDPVDGALAGPLLLGVMIDTPDGPLGLGRNPEATEVDVTPNL